MTVLLYLAEFLFSKETYSSYFYIHSLVFKLVVEGQNHMKPLHLGEKVGLNAAERTIFLRNGDGEISEVLPLVYVLWRKSNGDNSLEEIIDYTIERTQKKREFVEKIVFDVLTNLKDNGLIEF